MQAIEAQSEMLAVTMKKYKKELSDRRKYFNLVQELRGERSLSFDFCLPFSFFVAVAGYRPHLVPLSPRKHSGVLSCASYVGI